MHQRSFVRGGAHGVAAILLALLPPALAAQSAPAWPAAAAARYQTRFDELTHGTSVPGRVAAVDHLVLSRDVGELTLEQGQLYLINAGGRIVGAVFRGAGRFTFTPTDQAEITQLQRFAGAPALTAPLSEVVLLFADSTERQIAALPFGPGEVPPDVGDRFRDFLHSLAGENADTFDGDVLGPLLNGDTSGLFLARVTRTRGDPVLFEVSAGLAEGVQLLRKVDRREWGTNWAVVARFPARDQPSASTRAWRFAPRLQVVRTRIDVRFTERFGADLSVAAGATLTLVPLANVGPWLRFGLDSRLVVDSAGWGSGEPAPAFKADDDDELWVRMARPARAGDTLSLAVFYHGNMIDRYNNYFYVDPGSAWYPQNRSGDQEALFDITYHAPSQYPLVSSGERMDSSLENHVVTTRWVTSSPAVHATFNLGLFQARRIQNEGAPALDVFLSDDAHRLLASALASHGVILLEQRNMAQAVAADISNSLALFTSLYGPPPTDRFYVTEIPYAEGLSFPGLIDLSWGTFANTSSDGFDQFFRAHEVAHQWWGNGVRPARYRDAWLSEGLAEFCGLSYLQSVRRRNDEYYSYLDRYRSDILNHRDDAGPIAIGYRNVTPTTPLGYQQVVYEKGAWVFHMLRVLMLDLSTLRSDGFNEMLRDYYASFNGVAASTDDFHAIVERHTGHPMGWFFDEWVRAAAIPTYRVTWSPRSAEGNRFRVHLRIRQEGVPADFHMPVLIAVDLGEHRTARFRVDVHGPEMEVDSPLLPSLPRELRFNEFQSVLAEVHVERETGQ